MKSDHIKILLYLTIIGVILYSVTRIFKPGGLLDSMFDALPFGGGNSKERGRLQDAQERIDKGIEINEAALSKSEASLEQIAGDQFQMMYGFGTRWPMLYDSLKGLNSEDLRAVYKKFGWRSEKYFGVETFSGDLFGWYVADLSDSELVQMRQLWAQTGIWY